MKKIFKLLTLLSLLLSITSCGGFKAKRIDADESDEMGLEMTDKWMVRDSEISVDKIIRKIEKHKGFQRYLAKTGKTPKIFIAEVQNQTSEAYFPIEDFNDEMLNKFSESGDFILIDAASRDKLLKEIQYQNDGMVDPNEAKTIGRQAGADLLVFGSIRMKAQKRKGKTLKEYTVNIRMTNLERGIEVLRTRIRVNKFSKSSSVGW
ncbi:MAG: hypothetical protein KAG61_11560 [Bacteriovoracaceae bacterium]|nr:hypothetical protein [Bacteriovoracaceae bacterium]